MLAKTGLLIVSNPTQISKVLSSIKKNVKSTLYIQLLSALSEPFGLFHPTVFNSWPKFSQTISRIYSQAAIECEHLDVRVLLSGLKYGDLKSIHTQKPIDLVIFDKAHSQTDIDTFVSGRVSNMNKQFGVVTIESGPLEQPFLNSNGVTDKIYKHSVLGGTFDRLHVAHKLMLSESALRTQDRITVGVTEENMLTTKILWELIQPVEERIDIVKSFLTDICPELNISVVPIADPFGPTQHDPTMDLLVVSEETSRGGQKINEVRASKNMPLVDMVTVELIDEPYPNPNEEVKVSSSTARMRLLGTPLRPIRESRLPKRPYIIGLTGGICSGKSGVAKKLGELGAHVIDCDLLGHQVYKPGTDCFKAIVETFGDKVVSADTGDIDRKVLGSIVFSDHAHLQTLNSLVWPAIAAAVMERIKVSNADIVVVEAAILLTAGWQDMCHEVWTTLIPKQEAIERLKNRNGLTEEQAIARITSQKDNRFYVDNSDVVLSSLWAVEYTRQQVDRAWSLLQERIG